MGFKLGCGALVLQIWEVSITLFLLSLYIYIYIYMFIYVIFHYIILYYTIYIYIWFCKCLGGRGVDDPSCCFGGSPGSVAAALRDDAVAALEVPAQGHLFPRD